MKKFSALCLLCVGSFWGTSAQGTSAWFLMSGPGQPMGLPNESYVVIVHDELLIQEARAYLSGNRDVPQLVPVVTIAAGASSENLNYAQPGHPVWTWHVTRILRWEAFDRNLPIAAVFIPESHSPPSAVPQLLADGHSTMNLLYYPLVMEIDPIRAAEVVNLSTRGWVEAGERVLISGFIVEGGQPRNVFIRALGSSLATFGVQQPLADPKLTLFRDQSEVAKNDSWRDTYLGSALNGGPALPPHFSWMFPDDDREAILWLSLPPGNYTVHVAGADGAAGIALLELFDLDARAARD